MTMGTEQPSPPTATTLRIEGSNDLFIWKGDKGWYQVVPFKDVVYTPDDVTMQNLIGGMMQPHLFDPGLWPDGYIGFSNADERVYFDVRGTGFDAASSDTPYTVWAIIGKDANEITSGLIPNGPDKLPETINLLLSEADTYFSTGYTPV
jgi:hypothetical protein